MTQKSWYSFGNVASTQRTADVNIIDFIGGWGEDFFQDSLTAKSFVDDLAKLPDSVKTIRLHVNSPGGDVFAAVNIANALRDQRVSKNRTIDVIVEGLAASAASVVIMAGNTIRIADNALVMVHNPWTIAGGDAKDMRKVAERLDKVRQTIIATYKWQSSLSDQKIGALMDATTWMDADEAVANGFATEKIKGLKAAASFSASALAQLTVPEPYRARVNALVSHRDVGLAASGTQSGRAHSLIAAGASAHTRVVNAMREDRDMTIAEQIKSFENRRETIQARMTELMTKSAEEGTTLDDAQSEEYDTGNADLVKINKHLTRLAELETINKTMAKPVNGDTAANGSASRTGQVITVKPVVPPGTAFTRYAMALAASRGSRLEAVQYAKRWEGSTPEVVQVLNAAVAAGTTTDADWAAPLVVYQNIASEFVELLRPATIIGRIPGLRRVPFNVSMPTQTQGATAGWVGEGKPKPVSELKFGQLTLGMAKAAGIVVLSEELVRSSNPSAEAIVRQDLIATIGQFLDRQFIDPSVAAVSGVSPASITNGVTPVGSTGTNFAALQTDVAALFAAFTAANLSVSGAVWIMSETRAQALSMMLNALGQPTIPGITMTGGTMFGLPVVTSENVPLIGGSPEGGIIILVKAPEVLLADDGGVTLDVSREASLQMDSAPDSPATASTVMVSLWQNNLVGLRAERFINWKRRRAEAVAFIEDANYV